MSRTFFDMEDGDICYSISNDMAMDSDGKFLVGAAIEAIPILLIKLGEEGMHGLMNLLGRV